jgi:hypothetical protein
MAVAMSFMQHANAQIVQWRAEDGGNGHYYKAVGTDSSLPWDDANQAAVAAGGHLVTITSQAENDFVAALVNDEKYWFQNVWNRWQGPWIGAYQDPVPDVPGGENASANWRWVTDEPWDYTNWNEGEPNDAGGEQDKAAFWGLRQVEFGPLPVWNDAQGWDEAPILPSGYVIEWDSPEDMIWGLVLAVDGINAHQGISNALDAKLDAAINALVDANENNDVATCNALDAFINHCEAQSGNKLTIDQADSLIWEALEIIAVLCDL